MLISGNNVTIRNSSFDTCQAGVHGGAISITNVLSHVLMESVQITNSYALRGAGIWSVGHLTLRSCDISFNSAYTDGGGVSIQGSGSSLEASGTLFKSNYALTGSGGAISLMVKYTSDTNCANSVPVDRRGTLILSDCVSFQDNAAYGYGGAIRAQDSFDVSIRGAAADGCTVDFSDNVAHNGMGGAIAAVRLIALDVSGRARFARNSAVHAGALVLRCGSAGAIAGPASAPVHFLANSASTQYKGYGGAMIIMSDASAHISGHVVFEANAAVTGTGGGVYIQYASVYVDGAVAFVRNQGFYGGALCGLYSSLVAVSGDVLFLDNAALKGAGINAQTGTAVDLSGGVRFEGNKAMRMPAEINAITGAAPTWTSNGGGLFVLDAPPARCAGGVAFFRNSADFGGAVKVSSAGLDVYGNVSFRDNRAVAGGAIALEIARLRIWGDVLITGHVAKTAAGLFVGSGPSESPSPRTRARARARAAAIVSASELRLDSGPSRRGRAIAVRADLLTNRG
jgi:predicted outer membrane repeat protein